ncbi:hypothetical protein ACTMS8_06410 [Streptococcus suis]|uniref:Protein of uncharacterized function (DUF3847) n=1 Tax=Streptococcus suis TaxID=1307 RepID=A0A0Z8JCC1_STRSU|nr:hypothetical protein [Streptococcus suis]NQN11981.1 hypothetical protein [Streptococcus suis]NQO74388.1 hypothetical protein [Streptococcus suis]CYV51256.1 Protein of uncharacterised function (DUF3847) [Streptococcus suis]HEL1758012.1 hypothetical protein [Streptococcus suis]HEM2777058.1 hypothetical protein [Streptococcus suis]
MKELEKVMEQIEKEADKIEKAQNKMKLLNQKKNKLKRSAETQRKIKKGGVFEAFEREITGMQEETNNDLIYAFLDYVLSDNRYREKLKELTEIYLKERGIDIEETENPDDKTDSLENQKEENLDEDMGADFLESED